MFWPTEMNLMELKMVGRHIFSIVKYQIFHHNINDQDSLALRTKSSILYVEMNGAIYICNF